MVCSKQLQLHHLCGIYDMQQIQKIYDTFLTMLHVALLYFVNYVTYAPVKDLIFSWLCYKGEDLYVLCLLTIANVWELDLSHMVPFWIQKSQLESQKKVSLVHWMKKAIWWYPKVQFNEEWRVESFSIVYNSPISGRGTKQRKPWALEWTLTTVVIKFLKHNNLHIKVFDVALLVELSMVQKQ